MSDSTGGLEELRKEIDEIDAELPGLLMKRMDVSRRVGEYKRAKGLQVYDPAREQIIIDKIKEKAGEDEALAGALEEIYRDILRISKNLQK